MSKYKGLSQGEVEELLFKFGKNRIEEKKKHIFFQTIIGELRNPIMLLLIISALVSALIGKAEESIVIAIVVVLNILFTLFQVYKADDAVNALKKMILEFTLVIRDGHTQNIETEMLVPGDIVYLEAGNRVPADMRILEATYTQVNESILTGESALIEKTVSDETNGKLFMGTMVVVGQVYGQVVDTGKNTEFGKIALQMNSIKEAETNLQKKLRSFSSTLGLIGIVAAGLVFILSFIKDKTVFESFLLMVSLAVAIVPEGLPAVMTAVLSIGVGKMAKVGVIMRRLDAIEGLGDITILATDKTGTLTQNKMTVERIWDRELHTDLSQEEIHTISFLHNTSVRQVPTIEGGHEYIGDPTEIALQEYYDEKILKHPDDISEFEVIKEIPFSSDTKTKSVLVTKKGEEIFCINGAPEVLLDLDATITHKERVQIEHELQKSASKGHRTIAFAVGKNESSVQFAGFIALTDPLRPGIRNAITEARDMGIRTILITGDNPLTAEAIAVEAGITTKQGAYMTGTMIETMSDEQLAETLETVQIFARISPTQKLRLVTLLQSKGEIVAMTGDGVNDAPALKKADVGIAMGKNGSAVAKEAADAVVTDDNYVTIISGIKEGRAIVRRIELATTFFVAGNVGKFLYVLAALLLDLPLISPLQILFINLITDAIPALALSFAPLKIQKKKQGKKLAGILQVPEYIYIAISSVILAVSALVVTYVFRADIPVAVTTAFVMLIFVHQVMLFDIWLGMIEHVEDLKKILNKAILGSTAFTIFIVMIIFNNEFFVNLFELVMIPSSSFVYFFYAVAVYVAYILTRVEHAK
jgi:P-type Ca2+ transporter type 2C